MAICHGALGIRTGAGSEARTSLAAPPRQVVDNQRGRPMFGLVRGRPPLRRARDSHDGRAASDAGATDRHRKQIAAALPRCHGACSKRGGAPVDFLGFDRRGGTFGEQNLQYAIPCVRFRTGLLSLSPSQHQKRRDFEERGQFGTEGTSDFDARRPPRFRCLDSDNRASVLLNLRQNFLVLRKEIFPVCPKWQAESKIFCRNEVACRISFVLLVAKFPWKRGASCPSPTGMITKTQAQQLQRPTHGRSWPL
mmetsp:Transcript_96362/g.272549  ORF Transcript_96362/g.272549 Transcript_96362/m.272549 type:complete len:251 (-) Transcript_96362:538-1290(-)